MAYTNLNNPFYNDVSKAVRDELESRAKLYGKARRGNTAGLDAHNWLYGKTAYAKVKFKDKEVLAPPEQGFKDMYGKDLYPKPMITAVNITNEGDYGSLNRAEIHFTVWTLKQLEEFLTTLLHVRGQDNGEQPVSIEYGWTIPGRNGSQPGGQRNQRARAPVFAAACPPGD